MSCKEVERRIDRQTDGRTDRQTDTAAYFIMPLPYGLVA